MVSFVLGLVGTLAAALIIGVWSLAGSEDQGPFGRAAIALAVTSGAISALLVAFNLGAGYGIDIQVAETTAVLDRLIAGDTPYIPRASIPNWVKFGGIIQNIMTFVIVWVIAILAPVIHRGR